MSENLEEQEFASYNLSSEEWLKRFQGVQESHNTFKLRRYILYTTQKAFSQGYYFNENGEKVELDKARLDDSISTTKLIEFTGNDLDTILKGDETIAAATPTPVEIADDDCIMIAQTLVAEGHKTALLNFANPTFPGGGYREGMPAQEENICRRTSLPLCIDNASRYDELYPIPPNGAIFSHDIFAIRGRETDGYPFLDQPFALDVVTAAALCAPPLFPEGGRQKLYREDMNDMLKRIIVILSIARVRGVSALVLGAFGCGAFRNPPENNGKHSPCSASSPRGNVIPFEECFSKHLSIAEINDLERKEIFQRRECSAANEKAKQDKESKDTCCCC